MLATEVYACAPCRQAEQFAMVESHVFGSCTQTMYIVNELTKMASNASDILGTASTTSLADATSWFLERIDMEAWLPGFQSPTATGLSPAFCVVFFHRMAWHTGMACFVTGSFKSWTAEKFSEASSFVALVLGTSKAKLNLKGGSFGLYTETKSAATATGDLHVHFPGGLCLRPCAYACACYMHSKSEKSDWN